MKYNEYVSHTYQVLPSANNKSVVAYFIDGSSQQINVAFDNDSDTCVDVSVEELHYRVANTINRLYADYTTNTLVGYSYSSSSDCYFFSTNKVDFLRFSTSTSVKVHGVVDYELNSTLDDYYDIENYSTTTSYGAYSTQTSYLSDFNFTLNNNNVIFDYTSLYYANGVSGIRTIRGENVSFYEVYHYIEYYDDDNLYISYGSPYYEIRTSSYSNGYSNGYSSGWVQGQEYGYTQGQNSNATRETATAFDYIGEAFDCVAGILSLEVLPHITLGLCFSIPLTIVLIMTLFKLVKK